MGGYYEIHAALCVNKNWIYLARSRNQRSLVSKQMQLLLLKKKWGILYFMNDWSNFQGELCLVELLLLLLLLLITFMRGI